MKKLITIMLLMITLTTYSQTLYKNWSNIDSVPHYRFEVEYNNYIYTVMQPYFQIFQVQKIDLNGNVLSTSANIDNWGETYNIFYDDGYIYLFMYQVGTGPGIKVVKIDSVLNIVKDTVVNITYGPQGYGGLYTPNSNNTFIDDNYMYITYLYVNMTGNNHDIKTRIDKRNKFTFDSIASVVIDSCFLSEFISKNSDIFITSNKKDLSTDDGKFNFYHLNSDLQIINTDIIPHFKSRMIVEDSLSDYHIYFIGYDSQDSTVNVYKKVLSNNIISIDSNFNFIPYPINYTIPSNYFIPNFSITKIYPFKFNFSVYNNIISVYSNGFYNIMVSNSTSNVRLSTLQDYNLLVILSEFNDLTKVMLSDGYTENLGYNEPFYNSGYGCIWVVPFSNHVILGYNHKMSFFTLSSVNINNISNSKFNLYPNPTTNFINFTTVVKDFKLYNTCGQLLFTDKNVQIVDLTSFSKGIYIAEMDNRMTKIVKQ